MSYALAAHKRQPGTLDVNLNDGSQRGAGRCVITASNGDQVWATWDCAGTHSVECKEQFTLTGGTGTFEGISGRSDFYLESDLAKFAAKVSSGNVHETAAGSALWPALTYKTP